MDRFKILQDYKEIAQQISYLEQEGKTVVILAIDNIPSLIISLEESELSKPEANQVVLFLQNKMKMRVCMITGDNMHSATKVAKHLNISMENVTY